jgi:hypothetical protein
MKWFFALNESSGNFAHFADMVKVAVHSAARHTRLVPHFLYDGEENELTAWLRGRGVTIIHRRSTFYPQLEEIAARLQAPHILSIAPGAFLRCEIPALVQEMGWTDEYLLYTDCDVLFLSEVVEEMAQLKPRYFTIAPEENPRDFLDVNTGVMLMNPGVLARENERFLRFTARHLEACCRGNWDQTAYQWYYNPLLRTLLQCGLSPAKVFRIFRGLERRGWCPRPLWQILPIEYNWKPYWEGFERARIVHFHGPKPYEKTLLTSGDAPAHLDHLKHYLRGSYFELCEVWEQTLIEANASE